MSIHQAAYLGSYLLSLLGNGIAAIALPLLLLQTTGSVLGAGALAAATAVPAFGVGIVAGVVIDRVNRRDAGIVSDLISAAAIASLPLIDLATDLTLGWFVLAGVLGSFGDVPGMTAREAMLPGVVRSGGLSTERLVGLREAIGAAAIVIGPAAAGGLIVTLEGSSVLWVTAATSAGAALLSLLIPRGAGATRVAPVSDPSRRRLSGWADLREGWAVLAGRGAPAAAPRFLLVMTGLSLAMAAVLTAMQGLILPVHLLSVGEPGALGFVLTSLALGSLLGAGAYAAVGQRGTRRAWLLISLVGTVLGFGLVGLVGPIWSIFLGAGVVGLATGALGSLTGVLMLERIPDAARGRVMGSQNALLALAAPLGIVLASVVTDRLDVGAAGLILAGAWAVVAFAATWARSLRHLDPPPATRTVVSVGPGEPTALARTGPAGSP